MKSSIVRGLILNAFDMTYRSFMGYFSTIFTYKFGLNDKNQAADKPTGPAPTINIDFFFISLILKKYKFKINFR